MSFKKMWPLVAILVGLLAVGLLTKGKPTQRAITEEAGLRALVPADFLATDVERFEISMPARSGEKTEGKTVRLERKGEKDWQIASAWGAPADEMKVSTFLSKIKKLEGEYRSSSPEVLSDYDLDEKQALHMAFFKKNGKDAWLDLFVGKKSDGGSCFVRVKGSDEVHEVAVNLRSEVGLWEDGKAPEDKHWLRKKFVTFDKGKVEKLHLRYADKELFFEKRTRELPASAEKSPDSTAPAKKDAAPKVETEWVCTNLPEGMTLSKTVVSDVLRGLSELEATEVVDPSKSQDWGLDTPELAVELDAPKGKILLRGHRVSPGGDGYFSLEGAGQVYKVSQWNVDKVFPKAEKIFGKVGTVNARESELKEIEIRKDGKTMRIHRQDDKSWKLVEPADAVVDAGKLGDIAWGISALRIEDMALVDGASLGLVAGDRSLRYTLSNGTSTVWVIGKESPFVEGYYARRSGNDRVFVLNKSALDRAMKTAEDLPPEAETPSIAPKIPGGMGR